MSQKPWLRACTLSASCLEVQADEDGQIALRDSDNPTLVIVASSASFAEFINGAKAGVFDHLLPTQTTKG